MKRTLSTLLLFLLLALITALSFACSEEKQKAEHKTSMLFLGDSIAEAVAGPAPLTEREAYGYYGIIGNSNEFDYHNRAVSGYTTADLATYVKREDDGLNMVRSLISSADVIHISIIGNDFLFTNRTYMLIELSQGIYDRIRAKQASAKQNLHEALSYIRTLNPNATIIMQTLYNPAGPDSPLISDYARYYLAQNGITAEGYHDLMGLLVREINSELINYQKENTVTDEKGNTIKPFELLDVYSAFEEVYQRDYDRWTTLFCGDGIHPLNEGHAIIAAKIQEKLTELGFSSPHALDNYKQCKTGQLERLFFTLESKETVKANILSAQTFQAVSEAYFSGTMGAVPRYTEMPVKQGKTFSENLKFSITEATLQDSKILGALNKNKSYIAFHADGTYELSLVLNSLARGAIRSMISEEGGIDVDDYVQLKEVLPYVNNIAPGTKETDLEGLVKGLKDYYGIEIQGIDFNKPCVVSMLAYFAEHKKLIISDPDVVGDTVAVRFTGHYRLENMENPLTGERLTVIYVNNGIGQNESYVRYTLSQNDKGEKTVRMTIDVVNVVLEGTIIKED